MIKDTFSQLVNQNTCLQKTIDSLNIQHRLNELTIKLDTQNNIATEVNSFYDSAWTKLIIVISILGIILPVIIQFFQRKDLKELSKNLKENFDSKLIQLKENNELQINELIEKHEEKIGHLEVKQEKALIEIDANTLYLQGRTQILDKNFFMASYSFLRALSLLKKCGRLDRIVPTINSLRECINRVDNSHISQLNELLIKSKDKKNIEMILEELENDITDDSTIHETIKEIRQIMAKTS